MCPRCAHAPWCDNTFKTTQSTRRKAGDAHERRTYTSTPAYKGVPVTLYMARGRRGVTAPGRSTRTLTQWGWARYYNIYNISILNYRSSSRSELQSALQSLRGNGCGSLRAWNARVKSIGYIYIYLYARVLFACGGDIAHYGDGHRFMGGPVSHSVSSPSPTILSLTACK